MAQMMPAAADAPVAPGAKAVPKPITVPLATGSEGVIPLVAVPITELDLSVAAGDPRLDGDHRLLVKLSGSSNLPDQTECSVAMRFPPAPPPDPAVVTLQRPDRIELGIWKLANTGANGGASLDLVIDLFQTRMFYDAAVTLEVKPSFPCAPAFLVRGELPLTYGVALRYDAPDALLIGTEVRITPEVGEGLKAWCTLRLFLWKLDPSVAPAVVPPLSDAEVAGDSVAWGVDQDFEPQTIRLGCSPVDGPAVLLYPGALARNGVDPKDDAQLKFLHRLFIEGTDPAKNRCELFSKPFAVTRPVIRKLAVALRNAQLHDVADPASCRYVYGVGKIDNVADSLLLDLELSLWTAQATSQGQPLLLVDRVDVVDEVRVSEDGSFADILHQFDSDPLPDQSDLRASKLFCAARIPAEVMGSTRASFADAIAYDDAQFFPLVYEDLLVDDSDAVRPPIDRKGKTTKQLAAAVASSELLAFSGGETPRIARLPAFGALRFDVRGEQLYVSCRLIGPPEYWKKASPTLSVDTGGKQPLKTGAISAANPSLFEAKIPLANVCGKTVAATLAAPGAPDVWKGEHVPKPADATVDPFECMPAIVSVVAAAKTGAKEKAIVVTGETRFFPTQPGNKTLLLEVLKVAPDGDQVVPNVKVQYDLQLGNEGLCNTSGRLVATIQSSRLPTGTYKFRVSRVQAKGTVYGVALKQASATSDEWAQP